jgi:cobalt-zinc-cadmium efflux system protein
MSADGRHVPAWRHAALDARRSRLAAVLALTAGFMLVEIAGGLWTGSLALLADAGHMLSDVGSLTLGLLAVWFASRPPTPANSFGYFRVEILAALVNALVLLAVAAVILVEAYQRLWAPPAVAAAPMLAIAAAGLLVNLLGIWILHAGGDRSLLLRMARLELVSDALGSIAVIVAALVIQMTGFVLADPIISGIIGLFIVPRAWNVLRQAVHILMEGVPPHLDLREIEGAMRAAHGVRAVHDLHVWTLTSGTEAMSAHVLVDDLADGQHVLGDLQQLLRERFGIEHTTIQLETDRSPVLQIGRAGESRSSEPGP